MTTTRNEYPTLFIKDKGVFDTLFKKTLPIFVNCESEKLIFVLNNSYIDTKGVNLYPNDRQVFEHSYINNADANKVIKQLELHFFKLCLYKTTNGPAVIAVLKRAWRCDRLDITTVNKLIDANCIVTDTIKWNIDFPDKVLLTTSTIDDEICCTAWIWACKIMYTVVTTMLSTRYTEDEDNIYNMQTKEKVRMLKEAATIFSYLTIHGSKEMFSRFVRTDPIFFKAYVCFSYQKLAEGLAYILQANYLIHESRGINLSPESVEFLKRASAVIESGYNILKNGKNGADDAGIELPIAYNYMRVWAFVYYKFYQSRYLSVTTSMLKLCYKYMLEVLSFKQVAENKDQLSSLYNDVVGFDERIESESTLSYITSTLSKLVMPSNGNTFDEENIALDRINKLEAMPDVDYNEDLVKAFKIPTVDQFLFNIFADNDNTTKQ